MTIEMIEIAFFGIAILAYIYRLDGRISSLEASLGSRISRLEGMFEGYLAGQKSPE